MSHLQTFGSIIVIHILEFIFFLYHLQNSELRNVQQLRGQNSMFPLLGRHHTANAKILRHP